MLLSLVCDTEINTCDLRKKYHVRVNLNFRRLNFIAIKFEYKLEILGFLI